MCMQSLYEKELENVRLMGNVSLPFLGTLLSITEASEIAYGRMDPMTKVSFALTFDVFILSI